jgi:hypothetical protein
MEKTMKKMPTVRRITWMIIAALALSVPSVSLAVVGGTDDYSDFADPLSEWYGMDMGGIARARGGSAVAIGNRWFLTARHFYLDVGHTMSLEDGSTFTITETHSPNIGGDLIDLKLVRVAEETDFWYDIYDPPSLYIFPGTSLIVAGTGYDGETGIIGSGENANSYFLWDENDPATARDWRWGTNQVDGHGLYPYANYLSDCIQMNFDYGETEYESGVANGDSGGGVFAKNDDGEWNLAGITTYVGARKAIYDTSYAVDASTYRDWIYSYVPTGDFNADEALSADDIDLLFATIDALGGGATPTGSELYDVNSDGLLDDADMDFLIRIFMETQYGDANLDGVVDLLDLNTLTANYNSTGGWADGDFDGDGVIGLLDLNKLSAYYNFGVVVPEPASMVMLAVGGLAILRRRRR